MGGPAYGPPREGSAWGRKARQEANAAPAREARRASKMWLAAVQPQAAPAAASFPGIKGPSAKRGGAPKRPPRRESPLIPPRFRPAAGIIQSWDVERGWQSERGWECPVIIDNMMNLELMFEATRLSGDSSFYKIAVSHADRTMEEHFRPDGSCYHVIDYSIKDGPVRHRQTAQGYADESIWSRGQAWAIYGYAVCYRETKDRKYLDQALKTFNMMKNLESMPEDLIPYWDMSAPNIPNEPRDVSTASCIASALYEISTMDVPDAAGYKMYADSIMVSLSSPAYRAALGTNGNFLLMHSVGSIPHNSEIDVPLNYADYYYLEALKRKRDIEKGL